MLHIYIEQSEQSAGHNLSDACYCDKKMNKSKFLEFNPLSYLGWKASNIVIFLYRSIFHKTSTIKMYKFTAIDCMVNVASSQALEILLVVRVGEY
jgi:hypothetical protein